MTEALTSASDAMLRALRDKVANGKIGFPLTEAGLKSEGLGKLVTAIPALNELSAKGLVVLVEAILAERGRPQGPQLSLVWTGPEGTSSTARDTWVVFRELMESARRHVLIAGFRFDHGVELLEPLHRNMKAHGVTAHCFLDVPRARRDVPIEEHARKFVEDFIIKNWSFGPPHPAFFYDPRTARPGSMASLHAKCVVVDERVTLVGSANFTDRGQSRNIEMGVLVESEQFASEVTSHWQGIIRSQLVRPV